MSGPVVAAGQLWGTLEALAPVVLVMVVALELAIHAAWSRRRGAALAKRLGVGGLVVVGALLLLRLGDPELDAGRSLFGGALVVDHLSDLLDLVLVAVMAAALALGESAPRREGRDGPLLTVLAGLGAMVVVHAGHLGVVYLGLELLGLSSVVLVFGGAAAGGDASSSRAALVDRQWMPSLVGSAFLLMGTALVYLGSSTLALDELGSHVAVAFNRWAAVQPYVDLLAADDPRVPPGVVIQARGKVVGGMAPVSSFLAGLLLLLIGLLARAGAAPFPGSRRTFGTGAGAATDVVATLIPMLAVLAALLRLLVGSLHAPQLVREPYGWASLIVVVGLLTCARGGWVAARASTLSELVRGLVSAHFGLLLTGVAVAAGFYGHRRGIASQLSSRTELDWSQATGDAAVASMLFVVVVSVTAIVGLLAAARLAELEEEGERLVVWTGLARRRPLLGVAVAVCLAALAGLPATGGFLAWATFVRTMLQHSSFGFVSLAVVLLMAFVAFVCLRQIASLFAACPVAGSGVAMRTRSRVAEWLLLAAALALPLYGVAEAVVMASCRDAAAGTSMSPGLRARGAWVRDSREASSERESKD